jgi:hypothetical protein
MTVKTKVTDTYSSFKTVTTKKQRKFAGLCRLLRSSIEHYDTSVFKYRMAHNSLNLPRKGVRPMVLG